jgi:cytochrome c-type biogenesis protein CcmH
MAIVIAFLSAPVFADSDLPQARWANEQLADPRKEASAVELMEEVRCLVCQGQSIADSDADLAGEMRAMIRQRVEKGESPASIRRWLVDRYGSWITYRPPVEPVTWPLWVAPIVLLGIGGWLLRHRIGRRR